MQQKVRILVIYEQSYKRYEGIQEPLEHQAMLKIQN